LSKIPETQDLVYLQRSGLALHTVQRSLSARRAGPPSAAEGPGGEGLEEGIMLLVVTPVMDEKNSVVGAIITGDLLNNDPFIPDTLPKAIPGSLVTIAMEIPR
jgi:hypothetical protein